MKISVLLVEDSKVVTKLIQSHLMKVEAIDFKVDTASSLQDANSKLEAEQYDCVLLDLTLPDSSADQTFQRVNQTIPETPIIVTSGSSDDQRSLDAMKHGAQDYLLKSDITPRLLAKTILYSIERKTLLLEAEEQEKVLRLQIKAAENKIAEQAKQLEELNSPTQSPDTPLEQPINIRLNKQEASRILLVEDSIVNQKLTSMMLKKMGLEVTIAQNGKEALYAFKEENYHLVLMDIQMPVMDGVTATKELRKAYGPDKKIIIIALSATSSEEMKKTFHDTGFNQVLTKPVDPDKLTVTLNNYLV